MSNTPLVSIIMPAYNCSSYVLKAVESIQAQHYQNWELLITDDCSTDDTWEILNGLSDERIRCTQNKTNLGYLKTCNALFEQCKGAYITFQDADDWSAPKRLKLQVDFLEQHPQVGICGTGFHATDEKGNIIRSIKKPRTHEELLETYGKDNPFCGATIMIRKTVYDKIGGYRPYFDRIGSEDYDWAALILEQFEGHNLPDHLYTYRLHGGSVSKEINLKRLLSGQLVEYLIQQRQSGNIDPLAQNDTAQVEAHFKVLVSPYEKDPALFWRRYASMFMYNQQYKLAIQMGWRALRARPWDLNNLRTFLYCIRKSRI